MKTSKKASKKSKRVKNGHRRNPGRDMDDCRADKAHNEIIRLNPNRHRHVGADW